MSSLRRFGLAVTVVAVAVRAVARHRRDMLVEAIKALPAADTAVLVALRDMQLLDRDHLLRICELVPSFDAHAVVTHVNALIMSTDADARRRAVHVLLDDLAVRVGPFRPSAPLALTFEPDLVATR